MVLPIGPQEAYRRRFRVVGHRIDSDTRVEHYVTPVLTEGEMAGGPNANPTVPIVTSRSSMLPDDTIIEVYTKWEVVTP